VPAELLLAAEEEAHKIFEQALAEARKLSHRLLGDVLAHELGHLLGSSAHSISGLMSGQWSGEGLRRVSEGTMFFAPSESRMMRDRLGSSEDRL
jgi:hypothetical protein